MKNLEKLRRSSFSRIFYFVKTAILVFVDAVVIAVQATVVVIDVVVVVVTVQATVVVIDVVVAVAAQPAVVVVVVAVFVVVVTVDAEKEARTSCQ